MNENNVSMEQDEINLMDLVRVIQKRKWLIAIGTLICVAIAVAVSLIMPKVYEAKAYLLITAPKFNVEFASKEGSKISTPLFENITGETFSKMIINEHTAKAVITKLGLDQLPDPYTVKAILQKIKAEYTRNSNLIVLKVQDASQERAAAIVNAWAADFIETNENVVSKGSIDADNFVMNQLEAAKIRLKEDEEELERFQKISKIDLLKDQIAGKIKQIVLYESKLDDAVRSRLIEKARYDEMAGQLSEQEKIADTAARSDSYAVGVQDLTAGMTVKEASAFIERQTAKALADLDAAEEAYKVFSQQNQIEILKSQIDRKVSQLADMKSRIAELDIKLEKQRTTLERTRQELEKEDQYIPVDKGFIGTEEINPLYLSLNDDKSKIAIDISSLEKEKTELLRTQSVLEQEIQKMKGDLASQQLEDTRLKRKLDLAETHYETLAKSREQSKLSEARETGKPRWIGYSNAVYKELKNNLMKAAVNIESFNAEILQLKKNIANLNNEVSVLKKELAEQELIQTRLVRNVDTSRSTFDVLSKKREETKISSSIKSATIQLSVPAPVPDFHIKPNKRMIVMIGGIMGLLLSILLAFFLESFQKSAPLSRKPLA